MIRGILFLLACLIAGCSGFDSVPCLEPTLPADMASVRVTTNTDVYGDSPRRFVGAQGKAPDGHGGPWVRWSRKVRKVRKGVEKRGQIYFFYSNFCLCMAKKATKLDAEDISEDV